MRLFYPLNSKLAVYFLEANEKATNAFGKRIERKMEEAAKKQAREEWMRRFREIQKSQKWARCMKAGCVGRELMRKLRAGYQSV